MILSTNAFNWAALRSGMGTGDFIASLTPEREEELFKQYNDWRRSKGLAEEEAPTPAPTPVVPPTIEKPAPPADDLSALINEVAAEVEEEEAEETVLVQNALDGADEIVEEETKPAPTEIVEEIEADQSSTEEVEEEMESAPMEAAAPEVCTEPSVAVDALPMVCTEPSVDFATIIRSLPKEADLELYNRIKDQFGEGTKSMAQAALKEATQKHRATASIRAFLEWLNDV